MGLLSNLLKAIFSRKPLPTPTPTPTPTPSGGTHTDLLNAHNAERTSRGLTNFAGNGKLASAAQDHANFMAKKNVMKHSGMGDGDLASRLRLVGYNATTGGENIGAGQRNIPEIMAGWMNSPGHRAAILGAYKEYGGGVAKAADGMLYWCSVFGTAGAQGESQLRIIGGILPEEGPPIETENGYLAQPYEF